MLQCPFCGSPQTDRIDVAGRRFLVFGCMFTPEVDPALSDGEIAERLRTDFGPEGAGYFRKTCDVLHVYVAKGDGAKVLTARRPEVANPPPS